MPFVLLSGGLIAGARHRINISNWHPRLMFRFYETTLNTLW